LSALQLMFLVAVLGSAVASSTIGVMALRRAARLEAGRWLALMALAQGAWSALYAGEVVAGTLAGKVIWDKLEWAPIVLAINGTWVFALSFAGGRARALRVVGPFNLALGVIFLVGVASDPWHGLGYHGAHLVAEPFPALLYDYGPSLLAGMLWLYVLATWSLVALVRRTLSTHALYRRQIALVLLGMSIPYAGGFFTLTGATWDLSPFTFAASDLVLGFALFRYGLLQVVPIARELVFEHISDGAVVEDPTGRVVDLNPACERLLGDAAAGALGSSLDELARRLGVQLPPTGGAADWELVHGGATRYLHATATAIPDRRGQPAGRVLLVRDLTAVRQAHLEIQHAAEDLARVNRDLERANGELETFNYSVSHELQAPLRHMRSFAGILAEEARDQLTPSALELVARIQRASDRMTALVNGMLRLARIGRRTLKTERLALDRIAAEVVLHLRNAEPTRQVEVRIAEGLDAVGDHGLMTGLLQNLLENAFKFTRGRAIPAVIEVGRTVTDRGPSFFVRDNGVGFDPRNADRLFLPFQRLHVEGEFEGTGIGLSLVRQIVERHGGEVWAESVKGEGTTFYFTLALAPHRATP